MSFAVLQFRQVVTHQPAQQQVLPSITVLLNVRPVSHSLAVSKLVWSYQLNMATFERQISQYAVQMFCMTAGNKEKKHFC